ncbi:ArsR/SmtB family transcription factor [Streptococcus devriesei]|uniref:ArsR/SmtB family transcription factor n=1 Tax=Streptococcus devriesei TaxID=231233 RepID=UPI000483828E|nr:helix-turn-helix domain-containing protein [Streptococcus devriesei]
MKSLSHPSIKNINVEQILYALSEPTRLAIFKELYSAQDEKNCGSFSSLGQKNNLSHHFKTLRECGIISVRIEGRNRYISLRNEELDNKFPNLLKAIYDNS